MEICTMKPFAKHFYKSQTWKNCRETYLKSVGGLCERCLKKGLYVPAVIVHHREWLNESNINNAETTTGTEHLEALCQACHNAEHFGGSYEKRYKVDELGRVTVTE